MAEAIEDMAKGLDDRDTYAAADVRFHVAVAAATGNRVALHAMHAIRDILERALGTGVRDPGQRGTLARAAPPDPRRHLSR